MDCAGLASRVWHPAGGPSAGMQNCIQRFADIAASGADPYQLIDAPLGDVRRLPVNEVSARWRASFNHSALPPHWYSHDSVSYGAAEWLVPPGYAQAAGDARLVFIHGGDSDDPAVSGGGPYYAGMTTRVANATGLPVLAFDFPTAPAVPWPQNIRGVLEYVAYALAHGPAGAGRAGAIVLVADSEGSLVAMQTALALLDPALSRMLG